MSTYLVTGGAGFFGDLLKRRLLTDGHDVVSIDLEEDAHTDPRLTSVRGDLRDKAQLDGLCAEHGFDAIFHCAAVLAHAVKDKQMLWDANVEGTRHVAECAKAHKIPRVVFTSSNCVYSTNFDQPVTEDEPTGPVEIYGRSKLAGEKVLLDHADAFHAVVIRTPTIIEEGRLGLLAILFEFIDEGRKVWLVGKGDNRYQFVYGPDLADACVKALAFEGSGVFNVGSDDVVSLREVFEHVIAHAGTGARVASLPKRFTLFGMRMGHWLRVSPLGPYHYRMIASNFVFDTARIKRELGWQPTLTNGEMLARAFDYYRSNRQEIEQRTGVSAHRQGAKMGVIRLLKWMS